MFALRSVFCYNCKKVIFRGDNMVIDYILCASLEKHCRITIMYQKGDEITQRDITVIGLKNRNIEAYCHLRHGIRIFKKDNILAAAFLYN